MEFSSNHRLNSSYNPSAMDASLRNTYKDQQYDFKNILNDLYIDQQVTELEKSMMSLFNEVKQLVILLKKYKKETIFDEYLRQLNSKVEELIDWIDKKKCKKTKSALLELFSGVDSELFKSQLRTIKSKLKSV